MDRSNNDGLRSRETRALKSKIGARGCVDFDVDVDGQSVIVSVSPLGISVSRDLPSGVANAAVSAVEAYARSFPEQMARSLLESARLRRANGEQALAGNAPSEHVKLIAEPHRLPSSGAEFKTSNGVHEIRVLVDSDGSLFFDCDVSVPLADGDGDAAMTAAIDWIIADRERAKGLGLDAELFEELWR